jgi:hypothetical protein
MSRARGKPPVQDGSSVWQHGWSVTGAAALASNVAG